MTWRERIQAARERGTFTAQDRADAGCWGTCAVGEMHAAQPSVVVYFEPVPCDTHGVKHGAPESRGLREPGTGFWRAVEANDFDAADSLLDAIEDRVLQLKRESA